MQRPVRAGVVVALLAVAASALAACGGGSDGADTSAPPRPPGTLAADPELRLGRRVYAARCMACHGVDGQGAVGPAFTGGRILERFPNQDDQVRLVTNGRGTMPQFGGSLDDDEIRAVVRYEREVLGARP